MVNVDSPKNLTTHGGPHFVVLDGREQRIAFSNYFVDLTAFGLPGTGSGGDDKICIARILSDGQLIFDAKFRDELTGAVYVDFDRPTSYNWPNRGPTGNAKPHAMSLSAWTQAIDREAQRGDTYKILTPLAASSSSALREPHGPGAWHRTSARLHRRRCRCWRWTGSSGRRELLLGAAYLGW
jgi:hypothetical protein